MARTKRCKPGAPLLWTSLFATQPIKLVFRLSARLAQAASVVACLVAAAQPGMAWHGIGRLDGFDTQLHEDAHRNRGNGAGVMGALRTATLNRLRLSGFQSIRSALQALMHVMHALTALLAMERRRPEAKPC